MCLGFIVRASERLRLNDRARNKWIISLTLYMREGSERFKPYIGQEACRELAPPTHYRSSTDFGVIWSTFLGEGTKAAVKSYVQPTAYSFLPSKTPTASKASRFSLPETFPAFEAANEVVLARAC